VGFNLLAGETYVFGIGDHHVTAPVGWAISHNMADGNDAPWNDNGQDSGLTDKSVEGTFTYEYDTGAWTLALDHAGGTEELTSAGLTTNGGTYAPAMAAIDTFEFNANTGGQSMAFDYVRVETGAPGKVPDSGGMVLIIK
jgi:hypothetical protein